LLRKPSSNASNLTVKSRHLHVGMGSYSQGDASAETNGYVDPEFVTEEFSLLSENSKDIGKLASLCLYEYVCIKRSTEKIGSIRSHQETLTTGYFFVWPYNTCVLQYLKVIWRKISRKRLE
jgi:hypothetical protein